MNKDWKNSLIGNITKEKKTMKYVVQVKNMA